MFEGLRENTAVGLANMCANNSVMQCLNFSYFFIEVTSNEPLTRQSLYAKMTAYI